MRLSRRLTTLFTFATFGYLVSMVGKAGGADSTELVAGNLRRSNNDFSGALQTSAAMQQALSSMPYHPSNLAADEFEDDVPERIVVAYTYQGNLNKVPAGVTHVHVCFGEINSDGSINDTSGVSSSDVASLQAKGYTVVFETGGANIDFSPAYENPENFANSLQSIIEAKGYDGGGLDNEPPPADQTQIDQSIALISTIRSVIGDKLLTRSPQMPQVDPYVAYVDNIYNTDMEIINSVGSLVNYTLVQMYNNDWYNNDVTVGTEEYYEAGFYGWVDSKTGITDWAGQTFNYLGAKNIVIGFIASAACGTGHASTATINAVLDNVINFCSSTAGLCGQYVGAGYWDTTCDQDNNFQTSGAIIDALATPSPSASPTGQPTSAPTFSPQPSMAPTTPAPSEAPSPAPSLSPTLSFAPSFFEASSDDSNSDGMPIWMIDTIATGSLLLVALLAMMLRNYLNNKPLLGDCCRPETGTHAPLLA